MSSAHLSPNLFPDTQKQRHFFCSLYQACFKLTNKLDKDAIKRSSHHFSHSLYRFCQRTELPWKSKCELTEDIWPKDLDILLTSVWEKGEESRNLKIHIVYINTYNIFFHI